MNFGFTSGTGIALLLGGTLIAAVSGMGDIHAARDRRRAWVAARVPGDGDSGSDPRPLMLTTVYEPPRRGRALAAGASHRAAPISAVLAHLWRERAAFGPMFLGLACNSLAMGTQVWAAPFYERTYGWGPAQYGIIQGLVPADRTFRSRVRRLAGRALGPPGRTTRTCASYWWPGWHTCPLRSPTR